MSRTPVRIVFLGGLGEIGRNCFCLEVDGRILVVDCGIMFPDADMPGVDLVLPDFTYLRENADRVDGVVLTHGHEDHAGGLAYLLPRRRRCPIYGSALSLGFARNRIEEAGMLDRTELIPVTRRRAAPDRARSTASSSRSRTRCRTRSPSRTTRPSGTILHTGDFKLDLTPGRRPHDRPRPARRDRPATGVRLLLSDSTNAERPGFTAVGVDGRRRRSATLFRDHTDKRFIVACFASHLHRVQQIAEAALDGRPHGRVPRPLDDAQRHARPRDGPARPARRPHHRHRRGRRATRRARCASSAPARRASR